MRESNARGWPPVLKVGAGNVTYSLGVLLLVAGAPVVVVEAEATERARDGLGLRTTGKQIRSRTRRESVGAADPSRRGSAPTVTRALGFFLSTARAAGSKLLVVDVDIWSCCCVVIDDADDDDGESRSRSCSGVDVDRSRDIWWLSFFPKRVIGAFDDGGK